MEKSGQLLAETLQLTESEPQGDNATSRETDSVKDIVDEAWESYWATTEDEEECEPPSE